MGNKLGIDLGGTKIEAIIINDAFQVIERKRVATNRDEGYDAILKRIVDLAHELMKTGNVEGPIGICTPGAIDFKTGTLKNSNTVCLIDKPLKSDLESALALTGRSFGLLISNSIIDLFLIKAPLQLRGLKGLIGVKAKISESIGIIGPCADKL